MSSNVCSGLRVDFYWVDNPSQDEADHIRQAVDALFAAIEAPGLRLWTQFNTPLVKAAFKKRLQKATRGELEPPEELKPVSDGRLPLYEIRWSGIQVRERDENGGPDRYLEVEARLIHGEPLSFSLSFIGLRAHEKECQGSSEEIKRAQDHEIDEAADLYLRAEARQWGVARRTSG